MKVLAGLLAGIACGVFFGEHAAPLSVIGDAFIGLLRMTVLPYIIVSLVANIGRLALRDSRRLASVGGLVMLLLWGTSLVLVMALAASLPEWRAGSFFSTSLVEQPTQTDLLSYFIPSNIFEALTENQVPAVVILCICAGLALSQVSDRDQLISQLDILADVLMRVSGFVARLAPFGVFAIAASTSGTTSFLELSRIQAYFVTYTSGALLLGFVVLPLLVTTLTPFSYREIMAVSRVPMLTAFATGKLIIVLPLLINETERLFERHRQAESDGSAPAVDVLYPVAYSFPHVGKLLYLLFIPFAAWFLGDAMTWDEYPGFLASGLFAYFGGPILATPYLLDRMQLPHDMFQLFLLAGVYCGRVGDVVGVLHLVTFTLLTTCAFTGRLSFGIRPIAKFLTVSLVASIAVIGGTRAALVQTLRSVEDRSEIIARMQLIDRPVAATVFDETAPNPDPLEPDETLLERIRRRDAIRVGFNDDKLPFAYRNVRGELVGFDVNMAHALARDIGVRVEFVPFERAKLTQQLTDDSFDLVMSGLVGTLERSEALHHTESYMDVTLAIVVRDHQVRDFESIDSMKSMERLRIGFVDLSEGFVDRLRLELPDAELIELGTNREFFERSAPGIDGLLISAESGAAFTLLYPEFEVVVPDMPRVTLPLFYAVGANDAAMKDFLEYWITLKKKDGTTQEFYEHWILGQTRRSGAALWSVVHDVLGWGGGGS